MNKIYSGILSLVAVTAVVAGSAYALFSSQVEINGITLGTATTNLEVKFGNQGDEAFTTSITIPAENQIGKLSPGEVSSPGVFVYRNTGDSDLLLSSRLVSAEGDWSTLADVIQVNSCRVESNDWHEGMHCPDTGTTTTGWLTLRHWNENPVGLAAPAGLIEANGGQALIVTNFRLPAETDNEYANKTITNMKVIVTGTQVTPTPTPTP